MFGRAGAGTDAGADKATPSSMGHVGKPIKCAYVAPMTRDYPQGGDDAWSVGDPISFGWAKVKQRPIAIALTLLVALLLIAFPNLVAVGIITSRAMDRARAGVVGPGDITDVYLQLGGIAVSWITTSLFLGGMYRYLFRLIRTGDESFGDLFSSTDRFGVLFGLMVILGLPGVVSIAARPFLVAAGVPDILVTALTLGIAIYLGVRWGFSSALAVDKGLSVARALAASSQITEAKRLKILGSVLLLSLVVMGGGCACGVGVFLTIPIAMIGWIYIYLRLTHEHPRGDVAKVSS